MNNNICPANIFANNRTANEIGRIRKESISIMTMYGNSHIGTCGRKILRKSVPKRLIPIIIYAIKKLNEKKNVTAICAVTVGTKGNKPKRFEIRMKMNIEKIHGNNTRVCSPVCSRKSERIKMKVSSTTIWNNVALAFDCTRAR